jgi:hemoglobin
VYIGRDMKTAHAGLGITEAEWQANMQFTSAALEEHGVALREREEFLAILEEYQSDIVEKS